MSNPSFFCYDYETFGTRPSQDFPVQFAGVRTDLEFNPIAEPIKIYCKPNADYLPQPQACAITGITPQFALKYGVPEAEFIRLIHQQFSQPQTCVFGYNNLRFDDEITRYALYRNFFDPYQREWQNGNSRWDLIDVLRAARALRPQGIEWPNNAEGRPSFKLTDLTQANNIHHEFAHDALADVYATLAMIKLVKQAQPRLYQFLWQHRSKAKVLALLQLGTFQPLLHISGKYSAQRHCLAIILPLGFHPNNPNAVIVYDLAVDPQPLFELTIEKIKQRLFTAIAELPSGMTRIPIKLVHLNRCPILAPLTVLSIADQERLQINIETAFNFVQFIQLMPEWIKKIAQAFNENNIVHHDPDMMLYSGGFFNKTDRLIMQKITELSLEELARFKPQFMDDRLEEMLFRYKARNYPHILTVSESERWQSFCQQRIQQQEVNYLQQLELLKQTATISLDLIQALENYLIQLKSQVYLTTSSN